MDLTEHNQTDSIFKQKRDDNLRWFFGFTDNEKWVPKVGDKVRVLKAKTQGLIGKIGVIESCIGTAVEVVIDEEIRSWGTVEGNLEFVGR
ncbi:hypothetical protein C4565_00410 [Candidatus Parcubacteria bacterium]|nr:MAG: hypothetical protein C4565_00410 [Candidatus Parcubacteria bacterium]